MSDGPVTIVCERNITEALLSDSQMQRIKRLRNDSNEDNDDDNSGFVEVRRKSKRPKTPVQNEKISYEFGSHIQNISPEDKMCEICVSSMEPLPKQMAFARLLRSQNIKDVIKIKYKNNYKIIIGFNSEESATMLLNCEEFRTRGFKCQRTDRMSSSYGIVRQIDLDMEIKDLEKIFESIYEIESAKRLNRLNSEGKWVESETIRLCFKGSAIPPYVIAYGCRFLVEPFTFPVTQCAGCWKYGHTAKFCPQKRQFCPKCGAEHVNCETKEYKCINCKGPHMSIEKSKCPVFEKEKEIRSIMSKENCTYKKALELYKKKDNINDINNFTGTLYTDMMTKDKNINQMDVTPIKAYEDVLSYKQALLNEVPRKDKADYGDISSASESIIISQWSPKPKSKKKQKKKSNKKTEENNLSQDTEIGMAGSNEKEGKTKEEKRFNFMRLFYRLKEVVLSNKMLNEKITEFLSVIVEEGYIFIAEKFNAGNCVGQFLSIFKNG